MSPELMGLAVEEGGLLWEQQHLLDPLDAVFARLPVEHPERIPSSAEAEQAELEAADVRFHTTHSTPESVWAPGVKRAYWQVLEQVHRTYHPEWGVTA